MSRTVEEIQAERASRKAAHESAKAAQHAKDLEKLLSLEDEHGLERVLSIGIGGWKAELDIPTLVVLRMPSPDEAKRFRDRCSKDKKSAPEAQDQLASVCVVYPEPEIYKRACEACPLLHRHVGSKASELALGEVEAEGKG